MNGDFREDLFHRLNVIRVQIPALRERKQDIEKLTQHFLVRAADELGVETKTLHPSSVEILNRLNLAGERATTGKYLSLANRNGQWQ